MQPPTVADNSADKATITALKKQVAALERKLKNNPNNKTERVRITVGDEKVNYKRDAMGVRTYGHDCPYKHCGKYHKKPGKECYELDRENAPEWWIKLNPKPYQPKEKPV